MSWALRTDASVRYVLQKSELHCVIKMALCAYVCFVSSIVPKHCASFTNCHRSSFTPGGSFIRLDVPILKCRITRMRDDTWS